MVSACEQRELMQASLLPCVCSNDLIATNNLGHKDADHVMRSLEAKLDVLRNTTKQRYLMLDDAVRWHRFRQQVRRLPALAGSLAASLLRLMVVF